MDLDAKMFATVSFVYKVAVIDRDNINRKIAILQLHMILIPLQVAMVEFGIFCLDIVISFIRLY